jgi:predicted outer membrane lipoprotein
VPDRAGKLGLAAAFVIVVALALGLVQLTRSATQAAPPPVPAHRPAAPPEPPAGEPPASGAPSVATREHHPAGAPITPRGPVTRSVERPGLAPAQPGFGRELKRDADGRLVPMIPLNELRALLHVTDAPMQACIERSGKRPTGKATLSFTVAASHDKLVIETTGVQDEDTLAGYPELVECMHQTAKLLVLDGHAVPELGTPIYVRRQVRLEDGALAENSILNYSYNP